MQRPPPQHHQHMAQGGPPGGMPQQGIQRQPPPGQQLVGPSHPQHPQHHAWLAQQQHQHQGPPGQPGQPRGGPGGGGQQPPPGQFFPHTSPHPHAQQQPIHLRPSYTQGPPPPGSQAPNGLPQPPPYPSQPPTPGGPLPPQPVHVQVAPPARMIPPQQVGGPRPLSIPPPPPSAQQSHPGQPGSGGLPPPPPPQMNGSYIPSPQPPSATLSRPPGSFPPPQQPHPPPPLQQHPPPHPQHPHPHANGLPPPPTPVQQALPPPSIQTGRPGLRSQPMAAPPSNTLLAAHLAIHGNGPITATPAPAGPALSRLAALNDAVIQASEDENPLEALRHVIAEHFTDTGVVKVGLFDRGAGLSKVFEIPCSAWPRFQHLNLILGVLNTTLATTFAREYRLTTPDPSSSSPPSPSTDSPHSGSPSSPFPVHIGYLLRADDATWTSRFTSGLKVDLVGTLTVHLMFKDLGTGAAGLRIESLGFESRGHEEWVVRDAMEAMMEPPPTPTLPPGASAGEGGGAKDGEDRPAGAGAPKGRKGSASQQKGMVTRRRSASAKSEIVLHAPDEDDGPSKAGEDEKPALKAADGKAPPLGPMQRRTRPVRVPVSPVGAFGVTEMGMRCLEIAESVAQLQDLISFSLDTGTGPILSLARYADRYRSTSFSAPTPSQHALPLPPPGATPIPLHPATPAGLAPPPPPGAVIAASQQNPSTNSFYSSVTASPGGRPGSRGGPGAGPGEIDGGGEQLVGGKRKLSGGQAPNGAGGGGGDEVDMDPGSPQKIQRGAGGGRNARGGRGR